MKPHELRIGNLLCDEVSGEWMIVEEIGTTIGAKVINRNKFPLPDGWRMAPIRLTAEIMGRCGFERNRLNHAAEIWQKGCLSFRVFSAEITLEDWNGECKIEYLHQLQNLHFSLLGEEITVAS